MTLAPRTIPDDTVVETRAEHFAATQTHFTTALDVHERGDLTILRAFVSVPDGVTVEEAENALANLRDRRTEVAIEDAVPEGEWDGRAVLANLRAAGFDVVKAGA